jgi:dienelactone hydrolase
MYKLLRRTSAVAFFFATSLVTSQTHGQEAIGFRKHVVNLASEFSSATAIDMNADGALDIVSGAWWYEAPHWIPHRFRDVQQIRGRYDDYSNLPLDVDGDTNLDIVSVNYRSNSLYWCRNPGPAATDQLWEQILIGEPGPSETGRLVDIDGDGRMDVLPNGTKNFAAWYEVRSDAAGEEVRWLRHDLPAELIGHGIGAGDINGDGRIDIVSPVGWAEAPHDPRTGRWQWHSEFNLARDCGLPILCVDVDEDGDTDLIWGRGHDVGLYWTEQVGEDGSSLSFDGIALDSKLADAISTKKWVTHAIDTQLASAHTLMQADIDGDGRLDLVTGKRYLGHDGRDPGENEPLSVQWYRFEKDTKTWQGHVISRGGNCGIDLDSTCVDLDADGDMDILAPARCGLHWLENLRVNPANRQATPIDAYPVYTEHQDVAYYLQGSERMPIESPTDHGVRRQHILAHMEQVMGVLPNAEQRVPLAVRVKQVEETEAYYRLFIDFASDSSGGVLDRVPAYLLIPKNAAVPAGGYPSMLCLHPTHFELGKAQICGLGGQPSRFYAHELASRGYVCLAPDYPGFADYQYDFERNIDLYPSGTLKAIWNNIRALDLLESLPCVNRNQIGAIGHSLGGHNALYTAAFDQRIRCVVTSCGFNAFENYYGGDLKGWSSDRYMPRIKSQFGLSPARMPFDFHEVLAAVAPRPLFVNAPLHDANFEVSGVRNCQASVEPLYKILGSSDKLRFVYPDAEHDFPDPIRHEVYDWLERMLD